jgi:hypothetical protein
MPCSLSQARDRVYTLPSRRRRLALTALLASFVVALIARDGRAAVQPVRVDYEAHEGCPSVAVFLEELTSRTRLARAARPASPDEDALDVRVRITRKGDGSNGKITLSKEGDARAREVDGATCHEVVAALALITALKIDPEASLAPRPRGSEAPSPILNDVPESAPEAPRVSPPPAVAPAPPTPLASRPPVTPPPRRPASSASIAEPSPPSPATLRTTLGVHVSAAFLVAPRGLLGGGPFVELQTDLGLGASFRFAAEVTTTGALDFGLGVARFTRGVVRLDACPALISAARWLTLAPCLGADGGFLRGEGLPGGLITEVKQATVPWASLGLLGSATFGLGSLLRIDVRGGPQFPLVRRSFIFERPEVVIYDVSPVTFTLHLGAGLSFL